MGNNHRKTTLDRARDELMSHVVRCDVLDARMTDRNAWLDETMKYMEDRYPDLTQLEVAQLEMIGRQFIKPAIPHGADSTAFNRPEAEVVTVDGETILESEAGTAEGAEDDVEVREPELQPA